MTMFLAAVKNLIVGNPVFKFVLLSLLLLSIVLVSMIVVGFISSNNNSNNINQPTEDLKEQAEKLIHKISGLELVLAEKVKENIFVFPTFTIIFQGRESDLCKSSRVLSKLCSHLFSQ